MAKKKLGQQNILTKIGVFLWSIAKLKREEVKNRNGEEREERGGEVLRGLVRPKKADEAHRHGGGEVEITSCFFESPIILTFFSRFSHLFPIR